jgi:hypothetical protein
MHHANLSAIFSHKEETMVQNDFGVFHCSIMFAVHWHFKGILHNVRHIKDIMCDL